MTAIRPPRIEIAVLAAWVACGAAWAGGSRSLTVSTAAQFLEGTTEGTRIDPDGAVELGGESETLWGPEPGIVWQIRADDRASWVALSSPGRVLRAAGGRVETWYAPSEETLFTALALERSGAAWVGVTPGGRLLRLADREHVDETAETGAAFVWALASSGDGSLWIGTGSPGRLMRRTNSGELQSLLELGDDPVRCLTVLRSGTVVVGTGLRGRVLSIDPDGEVYALLDAAEDEITALIERADGSLWVLAARGPQQPAPSERAASAPSGAVESVRVVASLPTVPGTADSAERSSRVENRAPPRLVGPRGGGVYRIAPDGSSRRLWETQLETPFAMADWAGQIIVATGDGGRLYALGESGAASLIGRIGSDQPSALVVVGDALLVGGTTDARLERFQRRTGQSGRYVSRPFDAGAAARWGRVRWRAELPEGASVELFARAGNTELPDEFWGEWKSVGRAGRGDAELELPMAQRLQLRFELRGGEWGRSPRLLGFGVSYMSMNRAPTIDRLSVEAPGVVWARSVTPTSRQVPVVADDPQAREVSEGLEVSQARSTPLRKGFEPGARTVSWQMRDPEGDRLTWRLALARVGDENWIPIGSGTVDEFASWDSRALSDGEYRARLTVDDAPDNGIGDRQEASAISELFVIDHSRPRIDDLRRDQDSLRFKARDPGGWLRAIEWAVDDGGWRVLEPIDGVTDGPEESCEVRLDRPEFAMATAVRLRVTDAAGNVGGAVWSPE